MKFPNSLYVEGQIIQHKKISIGGVSKAECSCLQELIKNLENKGENL